MTFAISNNIITQSGVDANLSGLKTIAGVSKITSGAGNNEFTIYNLDTSKLKINATLTLDPRKEQLICSVNNAIEIVSGGTFNLGVQDIINGYQTDTPLTGLIGTVNSDAWWDWGILMVRSGGTFNWYGTAIYSAGSFIAEAGSTVNIQNGIFYSNDDESGSSGSSVPPVGRGFINKINTANATINNFRMIKGEFIFYQNAKDGTYIGITRQHAKIGIFSQGMNNIMYENNSIGKHGNIIDYCIQTSQIPGGAGITNINVINEKTGTDIIVLGAENRSDSRNKGRLVVSKKVKFTIVDHDGPVVGARFFIRDTDNGHRKNLNGYDDTADKSYTEVSDAQGNTPELNIITGIINVEGGTSNGDPKNKNRGVTNTSPYDWDIRGDTNTPGADDFEYHGWSYNHLHIAGHMDLKGNDTLLVNEKLFTDPLITEPSQSTVDAYGIIETPYQAYDIAKSYITKTHHQIHSPDHHDILLTRKGNTIITNNHDLYINKNAPKPFDYDKSADALTIKCDEFVGNVDCGTGVLRLQNGAKIKGNVADSTGISVTFESSEPFYILMVKSDNTKTYLTAQKSTGNKVTVRIPKNTEIRYTAKAAGKKFISKVITITEATSIIIPFVQERYVSAVDVSLYIPALVALESDGDIVFDKIDLRLLREESKSVFDGVMTSAEGIHRYNNYIQVIQQTNNEAYFYEILHDRINLDTAVAGMKFIRKAGLTANDKSYFGCPVFKKDRKTIYTPDTSNNDDVRIDNLSIITTVTASDLADIAIVVSDKVNASNIATNVNDIKSKTGIIKTQTDNIPAIKTETDNIPIIKTQTDKIPTLAKEKTVNDRTLAKADYFDFSTDIVKTADSGEKTRDYLFISDYTNNTIRMANLQTHEVTTIAGIVRVQGHTDGKNGTSTFDNPESVLVDIAGQMLYVTDWNNHLLRRITLENHNTYTIAGIPNTRGTDDGAYGTNTLSVPNAMCQSHDGKYVYFTSYVSHTIRRYEITTGIVTTILGTAGVSGSKDGANPTFYNPAGIIITKDDKHLIVADLSNQAVRKINIATKTAQTICGKIGSADSTTEGILGANRLVAPLSIVLSTDEKYLYVIDSRTSVLVQVNLTTTAMTIIAGKINENGDTDGKKGTSRLKAPQEIILSTDGTYLIISDTGNNTIRAFDLETANLSTLFGTAGVAGSTDGYGLHAKFNSPTGVSMVSYHDTTRHTEAEIEKMVSYILTKYNTAKKSDIPTTSQIEQALLDETDGEQLLQAIKNKIGNSNINESVIAKEVWDYLMSNSIADNSVLKLIKNNLDKKISDLHDFDYKTEPVDVKWINRTEIKSLDQLKNTESEIASGTKRGLTELSPQEKEKYKASSVSVDFTATNQKIDDVKEQTDKIPTLAKQSDITSDKNTEAEIKTAATKALQELPQSEKDKYKADLTDVKTKIDSIVNYVLSITNDVTIIKAIKLNDYTIEQTSSTEQTLTVYTDSTHTETYAQAKVTVTAGSNKKSITWTKIP